VATKDLILSKHEVKEVMIVDCGSLCCHNFDAHYFLGLITVIKAGCSIFYSTGILVIF